MFKLYGFPEPVAAATAIITTDGGLVVRGAIDRHPANGALCQRWDFPDGTPSDHGASIEILAPGANPTRQHGILRLAPERSEFVVDVWSAIPEKVCPPCPPPCPDPSCHKPPPANLSPFQHVQAEYATGKYELLTKEGCGTFSEGCCTRLHNAFPAAGWGHIRKIPPQNLYNGHAVDAIQSLHAAADPSGGVTLAGVYDIIKTSEDPAAEPAWSFKGPPITDAWYYPA